jgi:signal transduction histidine kinase
MPDVVGLAKRLATSWRSDVLLAAVLAAGAVAYLGATATRGDQHWAAAIFVLPYAAALAVRRRWPVAAAAVVCALLLIARPLGLAATVNGALGDPLLWALFLIAYAVGTGAGLATGLAATVLLAACLQIENGGFDPVEVMITIGPWLAGRIVLSRRRMTGQLEARNDELQAEQELFALESVRYERARIARELHDIVAHCLSVMVVQASAGQRVADRDGVAAALEAVAEAAAQAQTEIGRLVELLGGELPDGGSPGLQMVDELVRRASVTGLAVSCRFLGPCDGLAPAASEAAYRVIQEALTNALKHAPGAPVSITIREQGADVEVAVQNAAPRRRPSGLERSGGSYGLAGMRDRVTACGGSLAAGPTHAGGWQVSALLPATRHRG